jgi:hypothetical protein
MPTLETSAQNAMANALVDLIDAGTGSNGDLNIRDSGQVTVANPEFSDPAFGDAVNGVCTANPIASDTNIAGGSPVDYQVRDKDSNVVWTGSAGTTGSGAELIISSAFPLPAGAQLDVSLFTLTQPAT